MKLKPLWLKKTEWKTFKILSINFWKKFQNLVFSQFTLQIEIDILIIKKQDYNISILLIFLKMFFFSDGLVRCYKEIGSASSECQGKYCYKMRTAGTKIAFLPKLSFSSSSRWLYRRRNSKERMYECSGCADRGQFSIPSVGFNFLMLPGRQMHTTAFRRRRRWINVCLQRERLLQHGSIQYLLWFRCFLRPPCYISLISTHFRIPHCFDLFSCFS